MENGGRDPYRANYKRKIMRERRGEILTVETKQKDGGRDPY